MDALTNATTARAYIKSAIPVHSLLLLTIALGLVNVIGIVGNALVVYVIRPDTKYHGPDRERQRRALITFFIYNLALSDLFASLVSGPALMFQSHTQDIQNTNGCRALRGFIYVFPVTTVLLIASISIERFVAMKFPLRSIQSTNARRLIKAAWATGIFWSFLGALTFKAKFVDLDDEFYTTDCAVDPDNAIRRVIFLIFLISIVGIPFLITLVASMGSIFILRSIAPSTADANQQESQYRAKQRSIRLLVCIVLSSTFAYLPFITYAIVKTALGTNVGYTTDSTIRYATAIFAYCSSIANPVIYLTIMKRLRTKVFAFLRFRQNSLPGVDHEAHAQNTTPYDDNDNNANGNSTITTQTLSSTSVSEGNNGDISQHQSIAHSTLDSEQISSDVIEVIENSSRPRLGRGSNIRTDPSLGSSTHHEDQESRRREWGGLSPILELPAAAGDVVC